LEAQALAAHRQAQGGGSGVDVVAALWGGTLIAQRGPDGLQHLPAALPVGLKLEIWSSGTPASTPELLRAVDALRRRPHSQYSNILDQLTTGANRAREAVVRGELHELIAALSHQADWLDRLGQAAEVPIVDSTAQRLAGYAADAASVLIPAGAGGGDVSLWLGPEPSTKAFAAAAHDSGWTRVAAAPHASGLELLSP
jgi:phosphomevalonate kinase